MTEVLDVNSVLDANFTLTETDIGDLSYFALQNMSIPLLNDCPLGNHTSTALNGKNFYI